MTVRTAAAITALVRVGIGAAFVAAPAPVTRLWTGPAGIDAPAAQVLARGLGIRDLLIGLGLLDALRRGGTTRPWSWFAVACGAVDVAATAAVARELPASRRLAAPLIAATVVTDAVIAAKLP